MDELDFKGKNKLPSILQTEQSECSLACLAMVSYYYGHKIDINTLRSKYAVSQQGVTLKTIMQIAEKMNLSSRAVRLEVEELERLKMPAILHWDMNHFVVLKKVFSNKAEIHDPAVGIRTFTLKDIGKHFTGVALELAPTSDFTVADEERKLKLRQLWNKATGLKRGIIQLAILSLLLELFAIAMPYFSQLVIDDVLVNNDTDLLKILAIGFFLLLLIRSATSLLSSYVGMYFTNKMGFQFAVNVCRHLFKLPVDYFLKRHIGDIVSRFGSTARIKDFIASGIISVFIDGLMAVGTLIMMFIYSKTLAVIAIVPVFIYVIFRLTTYRYIRTKSEEQLIAGAVENTNFIENLSKMQGIKLFSKETDRLSLWQTYFVDVMNAGIRVQKYGITLTITNNLLLGIETILIIFIGAKAVLNNELSIGMLIAFMAWKDTFSSKGFSLLDKSIEFRLLDVHLSRLSDIAFSKPEQKLEGGGIPNIHKVSGNFFEIKDLGFRYSENNPILFENVNLTLEKEETVAIIGPSGCGKSTLIKILSSLFEPSFGQIIMHGLTIDKIGLRHYRSRIGAVLQDDGLLTGTIADNICFFDPQPDQQSIEHAAELAAIHRDISSMPMQYNTLVGNLGAALSGGQIQRILIARALYKKPELLFMDEATSHLDIEAEKFVNNSIRQLKMGRIIVAHRPETIKLADRIFQLTTQGVLQISNNQFEKRMFPLPQEEIGRI
jgi:ATP-binding cassette, subfamily B, bacterial CvaB/MchF/RaxB